MLLTLFHTLLPLLGLTSWPRLEVELDPLFVLRPPKMLLTLSNTLLPLLELPIEEELPPRPLNPLRPRNKLPIPWPRASLTSTTCVQDYRKNMHKILLISFLCFFLSFKRKVDKEKVHYVYSPATAVTVECEAYEESRLWPEQKAFQKSKVSNYLGSMGQF